MTQNPMSPSALERRRLLEVKVAHLLLDASALVEALPRVMEAVCLATGWDGGLHWNWNAERAKFEPGQAWSSAGAAPRAMLASLQRGAGNTAQQDTLRRALDSGHATCLNGSMSAMHGACHTSFPIAIKADGRSSSLMHFFHQEPYNAEPALLDTLSGIGERIGRFCQRIAAEDALRENEQQLQEIVNMAGEAMIALNHEMKIVLFNRAAQRLFGCDVESVMGGGIDRFIPSRLHEAHARHVGGFIRDGRDFTKMSEAREAMGLRANGEEFPMQASVSRSMHGGKPLYCVILTDISARRRDQERLHFLASYDQLTSLPNRLLFNQRLERALVHAQRFDKGLAVLLIDLDRFKVINDTLGHAAGDSVLGAVAARLMSNMRDIDTVARLGGDEFAILIDQVADARQAGAIAQKLIRAFSESILVEGREFHVSASIGISTYPADGCDGATLLKNADIAMYRAKEQGKNNCQFYAAGMNVNTEKRLALESGLRLALQREEFLLHYQPKVDIASGRVSGMEALVRWKRPASGMVSPAEFIPLAEETGLIVPIGEWVLKAACEFTHALRRQGGLPLKVAVNLSARQFAQPSLISDVARALDTTGLDPELLDLEITESMVMGNPERAIQTLRQLKSMGMTLSIDDFGTGYSSLGYLKRFPIDNLKIDRAFIKDIPANNDDATITRTIIAMGHNLRLRVVAEGVETKAQLDFLAAHGCDEMQGYYFSRPLAGEDLKALVRSHDGACSKLAA